MKTKHSLALLFIILLILPLSLQAAAKYSIKTVNQKQEGPTGTKMKPFQIFVRDAFDRPVKGIRVESVCINMDKKAKLINPLIYTDESGRAEVFFKNGTKTRQYKITTKIYAPRGYKPLKVIKFTSMAYSLTNIIFYVLGGLALFLFGMKLLSDGLQISAGDRMKSILAFLSRNKYLGVIVGFLVTAVLQSSSVTTVMLIGFVNAGIMSFIQSIGIIMGANIGTTITGFIISLKASSIAYPILISGFLLYFLGRTNKIKFMGQVFLGLGLVFIGLSTMASHVKPLKDSVTVSQFFVKFSVNPMLAVIAGMAVTFLIQSSSATLGLIITLGASGLIDVQGAFGLVLGSNIGTTITAQIAAIGGNINARRVAVMHSIFNLLGVGFMLLIIQLGLIEYFYRFVIGIIKIFTSTDIQLTRIGNELAIPIIYMPFFIAFSHAVFNVANTLLLLPFSTPMGNLVIKMIPGKEDKKLQYLEPHLLNTPALALAQTTNELGYMLTTAQKLVRASSEGLFTTSSKWFKKFEKREDKVDTMQKDITEYLVQLTQRPMTEQEAIVIPKLIHAVNDIERIGDLSENIMETAYKFREEKIKFSDDGKEEVLFMHDEIEKMIDFALAALKDFDNESAEKVLRKEKIINELEEKYRRGHIKRLKSGKCKVVSGIFFLDIVSNLERIADHLTNIAQVVLSTNQE